MLPPPGSTPLYLDVPAETLARDEGLRTPGNTWENYLRRMLPPVRPEPADPRRALASPQGMADFLLTQGPTAARTMAGTMAAQAPFWALVQDEVMRLTPA